MSTLAVIASYSVREHSRRRLILFFGGFSLLVTIVLIAVTRDASAEAVFGPEAGLGNFLALGFLQLFALIAALAVSMGNIGQPFANGEALAVLVRPVARWQFALGRFLGSAAVVIGLCLLMAIETQAVQLFATGELSALVWGHWAVNAFNLVIVVAFTTFFSALVSIPVVAAVAAFFINQITEAVEGFYNLMRTQPIPGNFARFFKLAWYLTPKNLTSPLDQAQARALAEQAGTGPLDVSSMILPNSIGLAVWAAAWLIGVLAITTYLARRKEV